MKVTITTTPIKPEIKSIKTGSLVRNTSNGNIGVVRATYVTFVRVIVLNDLHLNRFDLIQEWTSSCIELITDIITITLRNDV